MAHMGIGRGKGEYKTMEAVRQAVTSQLLETSIEGATGILIHITGGRDLSLAEIYEAVDLVRDVVDDNCNIIFGATIDDNMNNEVQVSVIATGFDMRDKVVQPDYTEGAETAYNNYQDVAEDEPVASQEDLSEEYEDDYTEEQEDYNDESQEPIEQQEDTQSEDISFNSKIDLGDTSIPPFLRKMKK